MSTGWLRTLVATALVAASCGSVHGVGTSSIASSGRTTTYPVPITASSARLQSPCPSVQPPPPFPASAASNRNLALVTLRGGNQLVVRDITDITHPTTVSTLGTMRQPQFVSATDLSDDEWRKDVDTLIRMPLGGSPKTSVASSCDGIIAFAWSPDGTAAVYLANATDYATYAASELHLVTGGQNRVISSMPFIGGGCETQGCADRSDFRLSYSPDGRFISLVQSFGGPNFRLWKSDGALLKSNNPGLAYRMSAWSGNSLYFVDANGVAVWRDGVVSSFLPGVFWLRPKGSPAGGKIVYAARDGDGLAHTFVVDTGSGKVRELNKARAQPAFLTSRYVWYQGERSCMPADQCDPSLPVTASGKTYIYDLQDGTETESLITSVADVWPHAA